MSNTVFPSLFTSRCLDPLPLLPSFLSCIHFPLKHWTCYLSLAITAPQSCVCTLIKHVTFRGHQARSADHPRNTVKKACCNVFKVAISPCLSRKRNPGLLTRELRSLLLTGMISCFIYAKNICLCGRCGKKRYSFKSPQIISTERKKRLADLCIVIANNKFITMYFNFQHSQLDKVLLVT